jgi:isoquinoline 1-oxidoreductase alpha subunit
MAIIKLNINGKDQSIDVDPQMPLLWAIRDVDWVQDYISRK